MSTAPEYRFKFQIVDETSGEVVEADWTYFTTIDEFGGCESVDIHVASMLRAFRRSGREEFERREYPDMAEKQFVTQTAALIRAVVENKEPV